MLPANTPAKVEVKEWEDYVGKEKPTYDPERNRPISSVITTRDNGQDCMAFAALAVAYAKGE